MLLIAEIQRLGEAIESHIVVLRVNRQSALVVVECHCFAQRTVTQLRLQNVLVRVEKHLRGDDVSLAKEILQVAVQNADESIGVAVLHMYVKLDGYVRRLGRIVRDEKCPETPDRIRQQFGLDHTRLLRHLRRQTNRKETWLM